MAQEHKVLAAALADVLSCAGNEVITLKYVVLNADNSVAYTFLQSTDDSKLYSADFLNSCVLIDESIEAPPGYLYKAGTNTFEKPLEPKPVLTQPPEPQSDPIADLAETVSDLMVEVDKIKLGVTDK